jgi:peptide/nickel transport system permease protein
MNLSYLSVRTFHSLITIVAASVIVFLMVRLAPGDPARLMLGPTATNVQVEALREQLGLNLAFHEQYLRYVGGILHGDFGQSIRAQRPALDYVLERLPASLELAGVSFLLSIVIGIPVGVLSAAQPNSLFDSLARVIAFLAQATPGFWLGLMLISVFAVQLRWLPPSGRGGVEHLVMPAVTLGAYLVGFVIRLVRSEMLEVLTTDYVRTARAKGLANWVVLYKHTLRNAALPVTTVLGLQLGVLLSGSVITETVFAWPGIGQLAILAIYNRDYPVVQVIVLLSVVAFVLINLIVDLSYSLIDPRIRLGR